MQKNVRIEIDKELFLLRSLSKLLLFHPVFQFEKELGVVVAKLKYPVRGYMATLIREPRQRLIGIDLLRLYNDERLVLGVKGVRRDELLYDAFV